MTFAFRAPRWLLWGILAIVAFLAVCAAAQGGFTDSRPWGDVGTYDNYGGLVLDGQIPYHDFTMEYPPGRCPASFSRRPFAAAARSPISWPFSRWLGPAGAGTP